MLVVFPLIFVAGTKLIYDYNFVTPLKKFPFKSSNTFLDFISAMRVTDTDNMIDNIKNKIESLHYQKSSLKNMPLWNFIILLEASFSM